MAEADLDEVVGIERALHFSPWTRRQFQDSLQAGHRMLVVRQGTVLLAYAVVMAGPDEAELLNITVADACQGRGYGRQLLEFLLKEAVQQHMHAMFLEVRVSNQPALALYRRLGFLEVGRRRAYYSSASGREDALVMRKELT